MRLCKTYQKAIQLSKNLPKVCAIETEYGDEHFGIKDGAVLELLHHGAFSENKPAASQLIDTKLKYDNFIVSHIDLDTIFGIMWAAGFLKKTFITEQLSELISFVDEYGFHKYIATKHNKIDSHVQAKFLNIGKLYSSWKFNTFNDGQDISKDIHKLILRIKDIIMKANDTTISNDFQEKYKIFEKYSRYELSIPGILIVYVGDIFLLDGYFYNNINHDIVIQYNTGSSSISISCSDEQIAENYFGKNGVLNPLKEFFGPDAGGRKSIGGSPRHLTLQIEMLEAFIKYLKRNYFNIGG